MIGTEKTFPLVKSRMIEPIEWQAQRATVPSTDKENLCGLLEKKNRFLGWSTRSVRLKGGVIEYSKRNGKTKSIKLADIISVNAKGTEIELVVVSELKEVKLKLRAENEILAFRWLKVVEAARKKKASRAQKRRLRNSLKRSDSDTVLERSAAKAVFKKQATQGDIVLESSDEDSDSAAEDAELRSGATVDPRQITLVDSPRVVLTKKPVAKTRGKENTNPAEQPVSQALLKKSTVPNLVGIFAKDLMLVFVQPVFQALNLVVNTLKKQE